MRRLYIYLMYVWNIIAVLTTVAVLSMIDTESLDSRLYIVAFFCIIFCGFTVKIFEIELKREEKRHARNKKRDTIALWQI